MKHYKIFGQPQGGYEAVKQGWSWPAFFFSIIWLLVKKMWALGIALIFAFLMLGFFLGVAGAGPEADIPINLASFAVSIFLAFKGNKLREDNLATRGFEHKGTVTAANPEGAIAIFLKEAEASYAAPERPAQ